MKKIEHRVTKESDEMIFGDTFEDNRFITSWCQSKETYWFTQSIKDIFGKFNLDSKRYEEIENIFDGNLGGFYFLDQQNSESIKWFLGAVMAEAKTSGKSFLSVIDSTLLKTFGEYILNGKIDKTFAKDIFSELINQSYPFVYDVSFDDYVKYGYTEHFWSGVRKHPDHILDDILKSPKYVLSDISELETIVQTVINENKEQFEKLKTDPRILNWFVGQCMKLGKGKISPPQIKEILQKESDK